MAKKTKILSIKQSASDKKVSDCPRIMIEKVSPQINCGLFPIKRIVGEKVFVQANIFADGHDEIRALLVYRTVKQDKWQEVCMEPLGNDLWGGSFEIKEEADYFYSIHCVIDKFTTWRKDLDKKIEAQQDIAVDLNIGIDIVEQSKKIIKRKSAAKIASLLKKLNSAKKTNIISKLLSNDELLRIMRHDIKMEEPITYDKKLKVRVERKTALFSSWYEFFPRSWGKSGKHGSFKDCEKILPEIAKMGFDIIYMPPIHPIGITNRKGAKNAIECDDTEPGCPWAIGSAKGGHKAINPELGSIKSFKNFISKAKDLKLEVALDLAYQCSPDHPYVKQHPQWFKWRPDGKIQYAENPPKKYEDILPINFETDDAENLWQELKSIIIFWIEQGVRIFRVDNPHTKPFLFWDWVIDEIKKDYPETIFLAEAFTRPNIMYRLAKGGFSQSYTYFTWRNTKQEFIEYMQELTKTEVAEYFRPNFWPNTPDILPEHLQTGGRPVFIARAVLAATLSSNYGIYGPAFELCVSEAVHKKEEYINSEKYEIKKWDWDKSGNIKGVIAQLNKIRKDNPALQYTRNIEFCAIDNDCLLAYYKANSDYSNIILIIVNLDPHYTQSGVLQIPLNKFGIDDEQEYLAHDILNKEKYVWQGNTSYIELDPRKSPAHIINIKKKLKKNF